MADVLADEIIAGGRHHMPLPHVAKPMQDLGHALGHGGLTSARTARERHVQTRGRRGKPHLLARPLHHQQGGNFTDAGFHRPQTNQL